MPGTHRFLIGCLIITALIILLPFATAPVIPGELASPDIAAGFGVWRANGCAGCHALYGHGESYASDLTLVVERRGEIYLREFMIHPDAYHPESTRTMPRYSLARGEVDQLIAFLQYVGTNAHTFQSGRLLEMGNMTMGEGMGDGEAQNAAPTPVPDPVQDGRALFSRPPGNCATCHSLQPDTVIVGPSLAGVASRAAERIEGGSAADYLRQSLIAPGDYIVPGFTNVMAQNLGASLSAEQINHLIAFLLTLEE